MLCFKFLWEIQLWQRKNGFGKTDFVYHRILWLSQCCGLNSRHSQLRICQCVLCARTTRHQGHIRTGAMQAHGIGCGTEGSCGPGVGLLVFQILSPGAKSLQCILSQSLHGLRHGLLFRQPGIEHLLHGPACFTKLIEPDHAGATFECVKRASKCGLLAQISGLISQGAQCLLAVLHHFSGFFQEDGTQLIIAIKLISTQLDRRRNRCRNDCRLHFRHCTQGFFCFTAGSCRNRGAGLHARKYLRHGISQRIRPSLFGFLCHWRGGLTR